MQLNRRVGRIQWNVNYTFSRTIVYNNASQTTLFQFVNAQLTKNVANRRHAVNFNFGYDLPQAAARCGRNAIPRRFWTAGTSTATAPSTRARRTPWAAIPPPAQPSQYWTGTPTAYLPFRCQMGSNIFLPTGQLPSKTEDPRLQVPLNTANFALPAGELAGHRQHAADPVLRPVDVESRPFAGQDDPLAEGKTLELRVETFNTFNHFNPSNPNTALTYNFTTGAQTNAAFGTIQSAQVDPRRAVLSVRFKFSGSRLFSWFRFF